MNSGKFKLTEAECKQACLEFATGKKVAELNTDEIEWVWVEFNIGPAGPDARQYVKSAEIVIKPKRDEK